MKYKKIYIFTFGRSDYGWLRNLIIKFDKSKQINSTLIIIGNHFEKKFGYTFSEIKKDKIKKKKIFKISYSKKKKNNTNIHIANIISMLDKKLKINKSAAIILGDRYEAFATSIFCLNKNIPIIHIGGGSITLGSNDEFFRNFISKISAMHFVETAHHKKNLQKMEINKKNIYITGAPSLENVNKINFVSKRNFLTKLKIQNIKKKTIVVTFHPETNLSINKNLNNLNKLIKALVSLKNLHNVIITYPNADAGYTKYIKVIEKLRNINGIYLFKNLGYEKYFNMMKVADIMVGNSSSGIIESSNFKLPVLNIGNRQKMRFCGNNVENCSFNENLIVSNIMKLINQKKRNFINPYKLKKNSSEIYKIIKKNIKLID